MLTATPAIVDVAAGSLDLFGQPVGPAGSAGGKPAPRRPSERGEGVQLTREAPRSRGRADLPGQLYFAFYQSRGTAMADDRPQPASPEPPDAAHPAEPKPEHVPAPTRGRPESLVEASAGTYDVVRQVTRAQWRAGMMLAGGVLLLIVLAAAWWAGRAEGGSRGWAVVAAVLSAACFLAGLVVVQLRTPKPNSLPSLAETVRAYDRPAQIAVGVNSLALVLLAVCLLIGGLGGGLWLVYAGLAGLNVAGAALAWPRVKAVRQLYPSPRLPYAR